MLALFPVYVGVSPPGSIEPPKQLDVSAATPEIAERILLNLVNRERAARGIPALQKDERLGRIARSSARKMREAGRIAHRSPDGTGPGDRVAAAGYPARLLAENLAKGEGVLRVHESLMGSPAHRTAMRLNTEFGIDGPVPDAWQKIVADSGFVRHKGCRLNETQKGCLWLGGDVT